VGQRWYRVEHRDGGGVAHLGRVADVFPHSSALAPFVSVLLRTGAAGGTLVLVDEQDGRDVARRAVRRPRWYQRPPRPVGSVVAGFLTGVGALV
jgi:hypothetical protein